MLVFRNGHTMKIGKKNDLDYSKSDELPQKNLVPPKILKSNSDKIREQFPKHISPQKYIKRKSAKNVSVIVFRNNQKIILKLIKFKHIDCALKTRRKKNPLRRK